MAAMTIFEKTTHDVSVIVEPHYDTEHSRPEQGLHVFSYKVTIKNHKKEAIQIHKRFWTITDAFFNIQYVEGEGVVGQQPIILPGESYTYTSYCPLKTGFGSMKGYYNIINEAGKTLKIEIPEFILAHPFAVQ